MYTYTKRAAELGMLEAMHNLGVIYLEGRAIPQDSFKAVAWFHRASSFGFSHSAFNAAKLFVSGGEDQKVKRDFLAAISYLELCEKDENFPQEQVSAMLDMCLKNIELTKQEEALKQDM